MINLLALSGFINGCLSLLIGAIVCFKSKGKPENKIFFLFTLGVAFWQINYGFWQMADSQQESLFFLKLLMIGSVPSSAIFYHLSLSLLGIENKNKKI